MLKNTANQKWRVFAFDRTDNTPVTGDAAQITADLYIDAAGANAIDDTNPTELAHGYYEFDLTQAETNGDCITIDPVSSTGDVQVVGCPPSQYPFDLASAAEIRAEIDSNSTQLAAIVADTNELQTDWHDGGRLDLILDSVSTSALITLSGTADSGDSTVKITLTGGVASNNYYNGQLVIITGGTGAGQARTILSYLAAGTVATPTRDFAVAPDETSTFVVIGGDVPNLLEAGIAQAGGVATITLDATASAINDTYVNNFIMITGGTGAGQTRLIAVYNGGTKVATILPNWITNPDATSIYQVLPMARVDVQGWLGSVVTGDGDWAALKAETEAIVEDTNELQTNQGDWATAAGFMPDSEDGSSFTSIPWNADWDAEVQSECADAITAAGVDADSVVTALWAKVIDSTRTFGQFCKNLMSIFMGNSTYSSNGAGTATQTFFAEDGTTEQITATITSDGRTITDEAEEEE